MTTKVLTEAWNEAPRVRLLVNRPMAPGGRYVLSWLQQALRARDNPVVDAAVRLGNALGLPVLVYHGVREDYPYASDLLHLFILGASVDLAAGCRERGLACVQHVDRAGRREKGLVYRLAVEAASVVLEDQPTFVARWQAERVAARAKVAVFAVNAACLVPPALIGDDVRRRSAFLQRHEPERAAWSRWSDERSDVAPYTGYLPFEPDPLDDFDLDDLVASLNIDHSLPVSEMHPPGRVAASAPRPLGQRGPVGLRRIAERCHTERGRQRPLALPALRRTRPTRGHGGRERRLGGRAA